MAIASFKPTHPVTEVKIPTGQPKVYQGNHNHNSDIPISSLLIHPEGARWAVDYYSQKLGAHNDLTTLDTSSSGSYQNYDLIKDYDLMITGGLSHSINTESDTSEVTGSGHMLPFIVPNKGDLFVSMAGTFSIALFQIENVERASFNKETVYIVSWRLIATDQDASIKIENLTSKILRTYHYHKDQSLHGKTPLLTTDKHNDYLDIANNLHHAIKYYFSTFHDYPSGTLVLPIESYKIYDHKLVAFLKKILDTSEAKEIKDTRLLNYEGEPEYNEEYIWDSLLRRDRGTIPYLCKPMMLYPTSSLTSYNRLSSIRFTDIEYVIFPTLSRNSNLLNRRRHVVPLPLELDSVSTINESDEPSSLIPPINLLSSYVLPDSFYEGETYPTPLEQLVAQYYQGDDLNSSLLSAMLKGYRSWPLLEQYYYLPIIFLLSKTVLIRN